MSALFQTTRLTDMRANPDRKQLCFGPHSWRRPSKEKRHFSVVLYSCWFGSKWLMLVVPFQKKKWGFLGKNWKIPTADSLHVFQSLHRNFKQCVFIQGCMRWKNTQFFVSEVSSCDSDVKDEQLALKILFAFCHIWLLRFHPEFLLKTWFTCRTEHKTSQLNSETKHGELFPLRSAVQIHSCATMAQIFSPGDQSLSCSVLDATVEMLLTSSLFMQIGSGKNFESCLSLQISELQISLPVLELNFPGFPLCTADGFCPPVQTEIATHEATMTVKDRFFLWKAGGSFELVVWWCVYPLETIRRQWEAIYRLINTQDSGFLLVVPLIFWDTFQPVCLWQGCLYSGVWIAVVHVVYCIWKHLFIYGASVKFLVQTSRPFTLKCLPKWVCSDSPNKTAIAMVHVRLSNPQVIPMKQPTLAFLWIIPPRPVGLSVCLPLAHKSVQ